MNRYEDDYISVDTDFVIHGHQGDIHFLRLDTMAPELLQTYLPTELKTIAFPKGPQGGLLIQQGEARGHNHELIIKEPDAISVYQGPQYSPVMSHNHTINEVLVKVHKTSPITHAYDGHAPVILPAGSMWLIRTQRESRQGMVRGIAD